MSYSYYVLHSLDGDNPAGYGVIATCDARWCKTVIDRGLGYLCGDAPHDTSSDKPGCGRYYCEDHAGWIGPRGACTHRRAKAYGRVISDLVPSADGELLCLYPTGHDGPHAWAADYRA